jgi:hypothetical protein
MTPLPYSQLQPKIQPLDLILFQGADFVSQAIRKVELKTRGDGDFSHVGLVVTSDILPDVKELVPGRLYVWESTFSGQIGSIYKDSVLNAETGKGTFGVQIRDLEEVITAYEATPNAKVAWGHLQKNPWRLASTKQSLIETMRGLHAKFSQRVFDAQVMDCCAAAFPCFRPARNLFQKIEIQGHTILTSLKFIKKGNSLLNPASWLFCSELVASIYQGFGILPVEKDPRDFTPVDFIAGKSPVIDSILYIKPDMPISMSGQFATKTQKKAPQ